MEALVVSIIWFLIGVLIVGGLIYLCFYVIGLFKPVPTKIEQIIWVIFLLICLLLLILRVLPLVRQLVH
jgi:ABC-type transport system involved in multi-copper enzyme maturation permease subunit